MQDFSSTITLGNAFVLSLLGMAIVFFMLVLLMGVIKIMAAIMKRSKQPEEPAASSSPAAVPAPALYEAPGSAGEIKLHNVPEKHAAMIMGIVADKLQVPLNTLYFHSIKKLDGGDA